MSDQSAAPSPIDLTKEQSAINPGTTSAALEKDHCIWNNEAYRDGYEMCQGGDYMRCIQGAWHRVRSC